VCAALSEFGRGVTGPSWIQCGNLFLIALYRVGLGNISNTKSVGSGVYECRVNFGPGYRVYFGKDGERMVVLLGSGTKRNQQRDIRLALDRWDDYKQWKKEQNKED
jgi:putative addiction module killer protein